MVRTLHDLSNTSFFFSTKLLVFPKTKPWSSRSFDHLCFFFLRSYWSFQNNTSVYTIHLHHDFNVWEHSRSWLWPSMFKKSMILQEVSMTNIIIFPTNHQEWVHSPRSLYDPYNDISYHKEWVHSYMNYARAPSVLQLNKSSYVGKSIIVHNKFACILNYLYKK